MQHQSHGRRESLYPMILMPLIFRIDNNPLLDQYFAMD